MRKDYDFKSMFNELTDLRNRISMDGGDDIYQEDHILLDEILDLLEYELELNEFTKNIRESE